MNSHTIHVPTHVLISESVTDRSHREGKGREEEGKWKCVAHASSSPTSSNREPVDNSLRVPFPTMHAFDSIGALS